MTFTFPPSKTAELHYRDDQGTSALLKPTFLRRPSVSTAACEHSHEWLSLQCPGRLLLEALRRCDSVQHGEACGPNTFFRCAKCGGRVGCRTPPPIGRPCHVSRD